MAAPAYFPEAFVFLAAIARQHRGRKELDDAFGLPASERVRRHLDCIARRKKGNRASRGPQKFHFPWTPDEKGAFKKVSSAAGDIGCVDGSVAVIIAPKGDHHKAASYCCKKHYADIVMLLFTLSSGLRRRHGNLVVNHCVWGQQTTPASGGQRGCGSDSKGARIAATIPFR
ncbi:hypothetical protein MTO96_000979 [Rhipicephalus appendiculatus]